ncbi:MAG: VOC family protein [Ilumatobacteraceae bacterium]
MGIKGIHHAALAVHDLDAAKAFYGGALGFTEMPERPPVASPGVWYRAGASQVHIGVVAGDVPRQLGHVAFEVDDVDAIATHLEEAGITVRRLDRLPNAGRQIVVRDPSGNALEFNQPDSPTSELAEA